MAFTRCSAPLWKRALAKRRKQRRCKPSGEETIRLARFVNWVRAVLDMEPLPIRVIVRAPPRETCAEREFYE